VSLTKNMGTIDRIARTAVALGIVGLYLAGRISGTMAVLLGILGGTLVLTSLVAWCPAYPILGISTRKGGS